MFEMRLEPPFDRGITWSAASGFFLSQHKHLFSYLSHRTINSAAVNVPTAFAFTALRLAELATHICGLALHHLACLAFILFGCAFSHTFASASFLSLLFLFQSSISFLCCSL